MKLLKPQYIKKNLSEAKQIICIIRNRGQYEHILIELNAYWKILQNNIFKLKTNQKLFINDINIRYSKPLFRQTFIVFQIRTLRM